MLESLDSDTETRRLSPIAILGDGYLDLINGPQDHGWCAGYTCQKRLSLFPIIVAMGKVCFISILVPSICHIQVSLFPSIPGPSNNTCFIKAYISLPEMNVSVPHRIGHG